MVRRKSHPGVTKTNSNSFFAAADPILKPINSAIETLKDNLHTYPVFKKYKRLTSTPLGRITRDVIVVFTFQRWERTLKYHSWNERKRNFL